MTELIDTGVRRKKTINGENFYLYVSQTAVFCTVPRENDPIMSDTRQIVESLCEEISLALEAATPPTPILNGEPT